MSLLLVLVPASVTLRKPVGIAQIMNYALRVVRGRSEANTLRLMDGINSIGRHDDCLIRLRSSQVSRRHCELFEEGDKLILRDLGSSNGTFVNGKRVLGRQALKPGDVLTIGGVILWVDLLGAASRSAPASTAPRPAAGDTAAVDALPVAEDEFEVELEEDEEGFEVAIDTEPDQVDIIPLDEEPRPGQPPEVSKPVASVQGQRDQGSGPAGTADGAGPAAKPQSADEEDAVAQLLMDLKLDEDD